MDSLVARTQLCEASCSYITYLTYEDCVLLIMCFCMQIGDLCHCAVAVDPSQLRQLLFIVPLSNVR